MENGAYGYLRASTDQQDASVPAQQKAITEFTNANQIRIVRWFSDDGVSGKSFERPDYRRMRASILGGNPDSIKHIVVWSLSRFSRGNPDDFIVERRELSIAGVTILSATEAIRGDDTMADGLISYVSAYQNREFLIKLSKDVTRGLRNLVENGFWPSMAPLGYARMVVDREKKPIIVNGKKLILGRGEMKGSQHHVVLVPGHLDELTSVRLIFEKRGQQGCGFRQIAGELNARGYKTLRGGLWTLSTIRSCLTNMTYIGHTRYGVRRKHKGIRNQIERVERSKNPESEWITVENTHEPIIDANLFERVQRTIRNNTKSNCVGTPPAGRLKLFSSAIICIHCGSAYRCRPRKKGGKTYKYYECSGRTDGKTMERCDKWCIDADKLKNFIFGEIRSRVTDKDFQTALHAYLVGRLGQLLRADVLDTKSIDRDIRQQEQKKGRLLDSIADGLVSSNDGVLQSKFAEIEDRLHILNARKRDIEATVGSNPNADSIACQLLERVENLTELMDSISVEDQRRVLFAFCKKIVADADQREVVIETDLTGLAQTTTLPGLPAGLCNCSLPE